MKNKSSLNEWTLVRCALPNRNKVKIIGLFTFLLALPNILSRPKNAEIDSEKALMLTE